MLTYKLEPARGAEELLSRENLKSKSSEIAKNGSKTVSSEVNF